MKGIKKFVKFIIFLAVIFSWVFRGWPGILNLHFWNYNFKLSSKVQSMQNSDIGIKMVQAIGPSGENKISKEDIKIKFDGSQLSGKYEMQGASFHKAIKADKTEKTEIRIGNETTASFEPSFEFRKWDEVRFKLTPKMETIDQKDKNFDLADDKIKYKTPKEEVDFYELPDSQALQGGGYEIERILSEKPATNVLSFDIETENLDFFYQPIYTDAEIADKANNGEFINPDAMGSYAIYYKNTPLNYVGGKNYGTGKVGQIYRPRIDDSAGNWTYGELNIDDVTKKLTVTIPQGFLDTAVYPIYHASGLIFGYQTAGASTRTIKNQVLCYRFTMGTNAGMVDSMTIYSNPSNTSRTFNSGIYLQSSLGAVVANGTGPTTTPAASGAAWRTITYTSKPSLSGATDYLLCALGYAGGSGTHVLYSDTGTTNYSYLKAATFPTYPSLASGATLSNELYSIYATYTPVPNAPTSVAATKGTYTDKVTITWTKSSGATNYHVWRDNTDLGAAGDVATFDDTGAGAPTVTAGTASATDGTATDKVTLSISGASASNGTTYTYKVVASNAAGNSVDSATSTGYRGAGSLTYQWYRSSGDADSGYSLLSGATTAPYDDTAASAPTVTAGTASATDGTATDKVTLSISGASANVGAAKYYYATVSAAGASSADTTHDRGYRGVGSLTYQWYRSSGDADSGYSLLSGATIAPYDDTTAPSPTITAGAASASDGTSVSYVSLSVSGQSANSGAGRYFYATVSATSASSADTTHDRGYIGIGSLSYQWQRSAADSDASYSDISGATTASYNDTGAPSDGSGRYFKVVENATGATQQISTVDRGYRAIVVVSVSVSNGTVTYGYLPAGTSKTTVDLSDTQTLTNDGNVTEIFNIKGQNTSCSWTLAATAGSDQYVHEFCKATDVSCSSPPTNYTALTTSYQTLYTGVTAAGTKQLDLRVTVPTVSSCFTPQSVDVTIQATQ